MKECNGVVMHNAMNGMLEQSTRAGWMPVSTTLKEGSGRAESETKTEKNAEDIIEESLPKYNNTLRALCTHAFILEIVSN